MDTNQRIRQLMKERGLTEYRLALDSGLSKSTVSALLHRNTTPSVPTIEAVCNALGITVSQFFAEEGGQPARQRRTASAFAALCPAYRNTKAHHPTDYVGVPALNCISFLILFFVSPQFQQFILSIVLFHYMIFQQVSKVLFSPVSHLLSVSQYKSYLYKDLSTRSPQINCFINWAV